MPPVAYLPTDTIAGCSMEKHVGGDGDNNNDGDDNYLVGILVDEGGGKLKKRSIR